MLLIVSITYTVVSYHISRHYIHTGDWNCSCSCSGATGLHKNHVGTVNLTSLPVEDDVPSKMVLSWSVFSTLAGLLMYSVVEVGPDPMDEWPPWLWLM